MKKVFGNIALGLAGAAASTLAQPLFDRVRDAVWKKPADPATALPPAASTIAQASTPEVGGTKVSVDPNALQAAAAAVARGAFGEVLGPAAELMKGQDKACACQKRKVSGAEEPEDDDDDEAEFETLGYADVDGIGYLPIVEGAFNPLNFSDPFGQQEDAAKAEQAKTTKAIQVRQRKDAEREARALSNMEKKLDRLEKDLDRKAAAAAKQNAAQAARYEAQLKALRTARPAFRVAPPSQQRAIAETSTDKLITFMEKVIEQKQPQAMVVAPPPWPYGQPGYPGQPYPGQPAPYPGQPYPGQPAPYPNAAQAFPQGSQNVADDEVLDPWAELDTVAAQATAGAPEEPSPWAELGWSPTAFRPRPKAAPAESCGCG